MKTLKIYIKESIFDDVEDIVNDDTVLIEQFLKDNYKITGSYIIKGGVVDVKGDVTVKNKNIESLTNGLFRFGTVHGCFYCVGCTKLTSLKGAPEKTNSDFYCSDCPNLTSLEGAPEEVGGNFVCHYCHNLTSLSGAPRKVWKGFDCDKCSELKSLKGAPEVVGGSFWCRGCNSLTSLEGGPREVGMHFYCHDCRLLKITNSDRKKYRIKL